MRALLLVMLVLGSIAAVAAGAGFPPSPPDPTPAAGPCTVRDADGALVSWGDLPRERVRAERVAGRVVTAGEPDEAARHAYYQARDGACPECAPPPACQVELDAATLECVGWRYGPPSSPAPGRIAIQRQPTSLDAAQVEARRARRALEDALIRATADQDAATRAGLIDRAVEAGAEVARLRGELRR